jgi:GNAT superfamily N-acetyltransferase
VRWAVLSSAGIPALCALDARLSPAAVRGHLAAGQECLLGWVGSHLAYYRWDADVPTGLPYLGLTLTSPAAARVAVEAFTAPSFRRRGLGSYMFAVARARARARGRRHFIALTATWNTPIRRMAEGIGGRVVGTVGYVDLLVGRRYFSTGSVDLEPQGALRVNPR